jgi:branched-chain amino acid transport system ATP-binding protein
MVVTAEDYDAALADYTQQVPRRDQVPSVREVESGSVSYEFRPPPPPPQVHRDGLVRRFVRDVKLLDPRTIASRKTMFPLLILSALTIARPFGDTTFYYLMFQIQADFGADLNFIVNTMTLMSIVVLAISPVIGYLADRISRVKMIRIGTVLEGLCVIGTGLAPSIGLVTATRLAGSGLGAMVTPAVSPLVTDYFPLEKRARVYGFQALLTSVWFMVVGGGVIVMVSMMNPPLVTWRQVMVPAGIVVVIVGLLSFRLKEPVRGAVDRLSLGVSEEVANRVQKPAGWAEAWRTCRGIGTLRKIWAATPFLYMGQNGIGLVLAIAVQAKIAEQSSAPGFGSGFFSSATYGRLAPAFFLVFPYVLQIVLAPISFGIADRLLREHPERIMIYFGSVMALLGLVTASAVVSPNPLLMLPVGLVAGALASLIGPSQGLLLAVIIPPRVRGQGFQTVTPFQLLGAFALLAIVNMTGPYGAEHVVLYGLLPLLLLGAFILILSSANVGADMRNAVAPSLPTDQSPRARATGRAKMIVMRDVDVTYGSARVVHGVDFDVEDGELVALLGTNGAGKSTLLKAISGIHEPSAGAIFLDGEDITHKPAYLNARDGIVFLPGGRATFPTLTVAENLRAAAWLYKKDSEYVVPRTEEVLDFFPILRERLAQRAGDLSGGEQQMLALGQALLMKPRLLMIDELSLGLAPQIVERLLDIVRAIHADGTTVLLVEQSVNVALTIARRAVFMDKGEIRFDGPVDELLSRPDLLRAVFLGHSAGGRLARGRGGRLKHGETPEQVLAVEGLVLDYGGHRALDDVSLHVDAGEVVGIIGPNGAGKTSLFDVITGFSSPSAGRVLVGDVDVTPLGPDVRANLGLARSFQDTRLFPSLTVRETIAVAFQRHHGAKSAVLASMWAPPVRKAERRVTRRVEHLVELLNLGSYADKFLDELSTGTRRLVDIACVMALDPRILLLDEPSSGLAQAEIEVLGPVITQLSRETGCGVLVIEHDIPLVTGMADRLLVMQLGKVIADGDPTTVANDPLVVGAYLGASDAVLNRSGSLRRAVAALQPTSTLDTPTAAFESVTSPLGSESADD